MGLANTRTLAHLAVALTLCSGTTGRTKRYMDMDSLQHSAAALLHTSLDLSVTQLSHTVPDEGHSVTDPQNPKAPPYNPTLNPKKWDVILPCG